VCLLSNGGAESVEAALKLARAATRRAGIVHCNDSYHGTSLGALSVMSQKRLREPFEPLLDRCTGVAFGDLDALAGALQDGDVAAFIAEPVQAEAGVRLAPEGYFAEAAALCRRHGTLLILDEVQTGLGRTGTRFAFETLGVLPDIVVLAKSLGGGLAPIGATLTSGAINARAYGSRERFDLHSSTSGGKSLSCAVALETLRIIDEE
jgi:putrescine aminotransferase